MLGLARSGVAATRLLADAGAVVAAYDRRPAADLAERSRRSDGRRRRLAPRRRPGRRAERLLAAAELLVTSPSISPRFPTTEPWLREALAAAERRGVPVLSEVDLFLRLTRARVLAVTGTKGKTTTTALIGAMLDAARHAARLGGNIGTPLIERVDELGPEDWAVLELSELQLPTISRGADIAVYTNIGADHLDRHGSVAAYRAVKARLAELSGARDVILNADDPGCRDLGRGCHGDLRWYGLDDGSLARRRARRGGDGRGRAGAARRRRAAARPPHARATCWPRRWRRTWPGVARARSPRACAAFAGVPHRLETLGERAGVRWVNDSQATIPHGGHGRAGGVRAGAGRAHRRRPRKGPRLRRVRRGDRRAAAARVVLIGEIGRRAGRAASPAACRYATRRDHGRGRAPGRRDCAEPGDVVLLSPAAASFDMFADYAARGDAFRAGRRAAIGCEAPAWRGVSASPSPPRGATGRERGRPPRAAPREPTRCCSPCWRWSPSAS